MVGVLVFEQIVRLLYNWTTVVPHLEVCRLDDAYPWWRLTSCYSLADWVLSALLIGPLIIGAVGVAFGSDWGATLASRCNVAMTVILCVALFGWLALRYVEGGSLNLHARLIVALSLSTMIVQLAVQLLLRRLKTVPVL
jgi:hypothetical protein